MTRESVEYHDEIVQLKKRISKFNRWLGVIYKPEDAFRVQQLRSDCVEKLKELGVEIGDEELHNM